MRRILSYNVYLLHFYYVENASRKWHNNMELTVNLKKNMLLLIIYVFVINYRNNAKVEFRI